MHTSNLLAPAGFARFAQQQGASVQVIYVSFSFLVLSFFLHLLFTSLLALHSSRPPACWGCLFFCVCFFFFFMFFSFALFFFIFSFSYLALRSSRAASMLFLVFFFFFLFLFQLLFPFARFATCKAVWVFAFVFLISIISFFARCAQKQIPPYQDSASLFSFFVSFFFFPFLVRPGVGSQSVCMCVCVCMSVYPCVCMLVSTCHCVRVCIRERERERESICRCAHVCVIIPHPARRAFISTRQTPLADFNLKFVSFCIYFFISGLLFRHARRRSQIGGRGVCARA